MNKNSSKKALEAKSSLDRQAKRILVVQCCVGIGDMAMHLPYIHSLAKRAVPAKVSLLTKERTLASDLFLENPLIDDIFFIKQRSTLSALQMSSQLRPHGFSEVWILHHSSSVSFACWLAGIPKRYGYGIGKQRLLLTHPLQNVVKPLESVADHVSLPRQLFAEQGVSLDPGSERIPIAPINQAVVTSFLRDKPQPLVALGVGASEPARRWAPQHFATLIHQLHQQQVEGCFLLCGSKSDESVCQEILNQLTPEVQKKTIPVLQMGIQQMAGLLGSCQLVIGNDSSLVNIAAAMGRPTIGLFGVNPPLVHSPCITPVLPRSGRVHPRGMEEIFPDDVVQKAIFLLQR